MSDEEYVRANWDDSNISRLMDGCWLSGRSPMTWAVAAEFTRERLEQIRQLEAEVEMVKNDAENMRDVVIQRQYGSDWTVEYCRWCRILTRLESALADLRKGMRA